jgi:hypothetical protein
LERGFFSPDGSGILFTIFLDWKHSKGFQSKKIVKRYSVQQEIAPENQKRNFAVKKDKN